MIPRLFRCQLLMLPNSQGHLALYFEEEWTPWHAMRTLTERSQQIATSRTYVHTKMTTFFATKRNVGSAISAESYNELRWTAPLSPTTPPRQVIRSRSITNMVILVLAPEHDLDFLSSRCCCDSCCNRWSASSSCHYCEDSPATRPPHRNDDSPYNNDKWSETRCCPKAPTPPLRRSAPTSLATPTNSWAASA